MSAGSAVTQADLDAMREESAAAMQAMSDGLLSQLAAMIGGNAQPVAEPAPAKRTRKAPDAATARVLANGPGKRSTPVAAIVKPTGKVADVDRVVGPAPVVRTCELGGRTWQVSSGWSTKEGTVGHYGEAHVRPLTTTAKGKAYAARSLTLADLDALADPKVHKALSALVDDVEREAGIGAYAEGES